MKNLIEQHLMHKFKQFDYQVSLLKDVSFFHRATFQLTISKTHIHL
jgi:hypothetical protein